MGNTDADTVALINCRGDRVAVWHIVIDPGWPMSRLCGAWIDALTPSLLVQRYLLPFGGTLPDSLADLRGSSAGTFDPNDTRDAIVADIEKLNARHEDSPTKAGKPRASILWPDVPAPLDWAALPAVPHGVVEDPLARETIAAAMWVASLADAWAKVEVIRLSRDHLSDGDSLARPMPVALAP
ncbi:hypothetical protein [Mycolicibacterium phocaicum]|uniref:hypothetical protein n=1 Tax=Mycolicibacterium phocaicum TaxID=319706 RepID=UPI001CFBB4A3|nr:hypothetical protein [Mycolicibacterium phocaicum]UCZ62881.1 hypothetical protein LHJ73_12245 [Mycolicibacterium phocaicum]